MSRGNSNRKLMVEEQPVSQRTRPSLSATLTRRQAMETRPGIRYHMACVSFHLVSLNSVKRTSMKHPPAEKPKTSKQGRNLSAERWWFLLCDNHRLSQHNYTTSSPIAPANEERYRSSQNVRNQKRDWGDQMVVHVIWQSSSGDAEDGLWIEIPHFAPKHKQENSRKHNQHR